MKPTQGTSGKNRNWTREPSGRNRNQKLSDPSIEIKGKRNTLDPKGDPIPKEY